MAFLPTLLLCLFLSPIALSQTRTILEHKGEMQFGDGQERILAHKLLDGENKLLLVGRRTIRVLDVAGAKFAESRPIDVPEAMWDAKRLISPDGRRMIIYSNDDYCEGKLSKVKRPPTVWDLQTGRQIAVLDKTKKPVRWAIWSKNGKTLAAWSEPCSPDFNYFSVPYTYSTSVEVSFWDGETFEYKNSLPTARAGWWHLTEDGEKCIYTAGEVKSILLVVHYLSPLSPISVWDIAGGNIEQVISTRVGNAERKILAINVSPDEKFLIIKTQPPKSKATERRVAVWEIGKGDSHRFEIRPKYEIRPNPKIEGAGVAFSPGGKYLAFDAGNGMQIYETRTGEKKFEVPNDDYPAYWLADDKIILYEYSTYMQAFEAATGRQLYERPLIFEAYESAPISYSGDSSSSGATIVFDRTMIAPHPGGNMFLTYSNQYVRVYDSRTGEVLQTVVSPPMDYSKKKPRLSEQPLVSHAGWARDGKTLYVISFDDKSVSLWGLL
jgi:outer membrane protein assembly factor BamB